jgi:hypothetical protein
MSIAIEFSDKYVRFRCLIAAEPQNSCSKNQLYEAGKVQGTVIVWYYDDFGALHLLSDVSSFILQISTVPCT